MQVDDTRWTGEGSFTPVLIEALENLVDLTAIRVEDAPSSRVDVGYALIANEIFVTFRTAPRHVPVKHLGFIPGRRTVPVPTLGLPELAALLRGIDGVGEPDVTGDDMLQYLRTERIVPPYQTKGIKVVELVRIYESISPDLRHSG
jgi:hypothetical protein